MKNNVSLITGFFLTLCSLSSAGTLSYHELTPTGSDAGLEVNGVYTGAVYGELDGKENTINGVQFFSLKVAGDTLAANHIEISSAGGTFSNVKNFEPPQAAGSFSPVLTSAISNIGASDNSEQYVVLDSSSLVAGKTYDLRVFVRKGGDENRLVNLTFAGDGLPPVSTDFFNEDDATTSVGGFEDPKQAYSINYRFKWDGVTTPGITITQKFGQKPFLLYAVTNQEAVAEVVVTPPPIETHAVSHQVVERPVVSAKKADVGVESDVFYSADSLNTNGEWVSTGHYGNCWRPTVVSADWSPYTNGYWRHSVADGWIWVSNEPWGWATYHYGRWIRERDGAWIWIPGRRWAPAWVSWRYGGSYTGWAPLPPDADFDDRVGISVWADTHYDIGPAHYNFVRVRDFGSVGLLGLIIPRSQNITVIQNTTNITNIVHNKNTIYNGGPNYNAVNSIIRKHGGEVIPQVQIDRRSSHGPMPHDGKLSQMNGNTLSISAPTITSATGKHIPKNIKPIKSGEFDKGWGGVKDPNLAANLKTKMGTESGNLTAPNTNSTIPSVNQKKGNHVGLQQGSTGQQITTGAVQPGSVQPGTQTPTTGKRRPGSPIQTQPSVTPGAVQPGSVQPGTQTPTTGKSRPGSPIQTQPSVTPGAIQPGSVQVGTQTPTTGKHRPGSPIQTQPSVTPGAVQPGSVQVGTQTPTTDKRRPGSPTQTPAQVTTGAVQPGGVQPGTASPTTGNQSQKNQNHKQSQVSNGAVQPGTVGAQNVTPEKQQGSTAPQSPNTGSQSGMATTQSKKQPSRHETTSVQAPPVVTHSTNPQSPDATGVSSGHSVKHNQESTVKPAQTSVPQRQPTPHPVQQRQATPPPQLQRQTPVQPVVQQRQATPPPQQRQTPPVQQRQAPAPQQASSPSKGGRPTPTPVGH